MIGACATGIKAVENPLSLVLVDLAWTNTGVLVLQPIPNRRTNIYVLTRSAQPLPIQVIARASVVMGSWAKCDTGHAEVALKRSGEANVDTFQHDVTI